MSRRTYFLAGMWLTIVAIVVFSCFKAAPLLLARYYVGQLSTPSPETDAALNKLQALGQSAIPTLLDAIDDRDEALESLRKGNMADDSTFGWENALIDYGYRRRKSAVECRADLCVYLLVSAWNAGWLTEAEQRRVLRYLQYCNLRVDAPTNTFREDDPSIRIHAGINNKFLFGGNETLWVQRKVTTVVRAGSNEQVIASMGPESFDIVRAGKPDPKLSFALECLNTAVPAPFQITVKPKDLGIGKHEIYLRVSLGPTTKKEFHKSEESPWYEELTFGPLEVNVVPALENDKTP